MAEAKEKKEKKEKKESKKTTKKAASKNAGLSILELSELVKAIEEKFGVTAAPPMVAMGALPGAAPPGAAAADEEEQTEFDVILKDFGAQKIQVIKAVRELTDLGLRESKELVEGVPSPVRQGVSKEEAEQAKAKIESAGGVVDIQ